MSTTAGPLLALDDEFARELEGLYVPWRPEPVRAPRPLVVNAPLARELGLDPDALAGPDGVAVLAGNAVPDGARPVAQAYAGHQFGGWVPRLGDGRAVLLGELVGPDGRRRDVHLKGAGRTPFARGGDGRAAVGPMLREHVVSEALHALGVPTTRALAVVATGEPVYRETKLPGAVLARVAASHLRVGTFQYAGVQGDPALVRRLADYAIARHHPQAADADQPYLALFEAVVEAQAALVARWMHVGFVHGVLNTDNVAISGETIDLGPCAFMDAVDPETVFSSIDHGGRYAWGRQPLVVQWDLAQLATPLLPLIAPDAQDAVAAATPVLESFVARYDRHWARGICAKLGMPEDAPDGAALGHDLLRLMHAGQVDLTAGFRALSAAVRGDDAPARALFADPAAFDAWAERWRAALAGPGRDPQATAAAMDRTNPVYVPRNHLVEEALTAATDGDLGPVERLVDVVRRPFEERPGLEAYAQPAPATFGAGFQTFCGT
ncbi:protein adenylyltransferase SelO [Patulibacter sp. SYSU D01012]|uniref:protein adenylyltransferase SelO n=1 Tax=Patulibacter sp. SYSU D01012 TaxID=2817381 RepID=UPI001B312E60|nr:YdiU family protein [Patulibacter sp. SYSU D01012]